MNKDIKKIIKFVATTWTRDCEYAGRMENWCTYCGTYQEGRGVQAHKKNCLSLKARKILENKQVESEITDEDREELARLIKEGYTSGRIDSDDGKKISWSLTTEVWKD